MNIKKFHKNSIKFIKWNMLQSHKWNKTKKKKFIKYFLVTFVLAILPASLLGAYFYEVKTIEKSRLISEHTYWNNDKNAWTKEGVSPRLFVIDEDKILDKDKDSYSRWKENSQENEFNYLSSDIAYKYFNNINYDSVNKLKWQTDKLKRTSYLIKNQDQFIQLLQKHNPRKYQNKEKIIQEHIDLLDKVNFDTQDIVILNNYLYKKISESDNREKGLNIKSFTFDKAVHQLNIKFNFNNSYRFFLFHSDKKLGSNALVGADDWFKTYFLIIDKTNIQHVDDLNINFEYE